VRASFRLGVFGVALVCLSAPGVARAGELRAWRDASGQRSIQAELLETDGEVVKLRRADGTVLQALVSKFSIADQEFVAEAVRQSTSAPEVAAPAAPVATDLKSLLAENAALRAANKTLLDRIAELEKQLRALTQLVHQVQPSELAPRREAMVSDSRPITATRSVYLGAGGRWISDASADGALITLDDGSIWEISTPDRLFTNRWLPMEDIVVVKDKAGIQPMALVNKDNGEKAEARLLSR
jgi:hypothetical protein